MKIVFHENSLNLRGTSVAMFDYALHNQLLLGNESVILYNKFSVHNNIDVINKFKEHFNVLEYSHFEDVDKILEQEKADRFYILKSGEKNNQNVSYCPDLVHAVFMQNKDQVHGNKYAFVSKWLSKACSNNEIPYVNHMISLPDTEESLRKDLNIPEDAIVFGRYGGVETFDIDFVHQTIKDILQTRKNIYFLFLNTYQFYQHPNIIYLNNSVDLTYKTKFINTCDFMLHARRQGESFGLAVGEFNSKNKTVLTFRDSVERSHIDILGPYGQYYTNANELRYLLNGLTKQDSYCENQYSGLNPKNVMQEFNNVFLK